MAKARKDERGRALRKGEVQRASDKRYMYTYTDPQGRRKFIYAQDLATLRENDMSTKHDLRATTQSNYIYMYDRFVRETFGKEKFQLAVRDEIIRNNPSDGVMKEVSKGKTRGIRHALTLEQQRAFMNYIANHPVYYHWWPLFAVLLGTGCRIEEALGLRWEDLDFENRIVSVDHSIVYYPVGKSRTSVQRISKPKTEAGIRTIPMLDTVYDAFRMEREEQEESGFNETEIDEMKGFVFVTRFGAVPNPQSVNRTIKRITSNYNAEETVNAKKERREPVILPDFSCHHLRHTFCNRLCENETNLKVIQAIMGHRNIETTMDIYPAMTAD